MDTLIPARDVLTADPRHLMQIIAEIPALTLGEALHLAGGRHVRNVQIIRRELVRRKEDAEAARGVYILIPPYDKATPDQLYGGLRAAGHTPKTIAAHAGVGATTVYAVLNKVAASSRVQRVIMQAIAGVIPITKEAK